jgi:aspartate/methionine/tyrosine aminotransferase
MKSYAQRLGRLHSEGAFEVLTRAKALEAQGRHIIHMEIGEPDFDTPAYIVEAGKQALDDGYTHYTPAAGLPQVRQTIADYVTETRGITVTLDNVVVVPGGKPMIFFAILGLVNKGEEVVYPNPGFPTYESMIDFVGGKAVPMALREERGFSFQPDEFVSLINQNTKLIILNSPGNPTGGVMSRADLEVVAGLAARYDCWVLSDEIYSRMVYDGEFFSVATLPGMQERTIILDCFSKTYAMTGWRLGYGVMPADLAEGVTRLMINSSSCTAAFTQVAGAAALTGDQTAVTEMVGQFRRRRDVIVDGLNALPGITCLRPEGAFYVFPNVSALGGTEKEIADGMLAEAGVATLPGTAFGRYGRGYVRFSYATSLENINVALERIREWLEAR